MTRTRRGGKSMKDQIAAASRAIGNAFSQLTNAELAQLVREPYLELHLDAIEQSGVER